MRKATYYILTPESPAVAELRSCVKVEVAVVVVELMLNVLRCHLTY